MTELLLIDPDPHRRAELTSRLSARGFALRSVGNARDAETAIVQRCPDGIVIDGVVAAACRDLVERARERARKIQIVAFVRERADDSHATLTMVTYAPNDLEALVNALAKLFAPPPTAAVPDFASELAELRRTFSSKLPVRLAELVAAIDAAILDSSKLEAARAVSHRLRGAAGSYGHVRFGEAVARIDELLADVPDWNEVARELASATAALAIGGTS